MSPLSGTTDANGDFKPTYTAPSVTTSTAYTISAAATKTGYTGGTGTDQITVNPLTSVIIKLENHTAIPGSSIIVPVLLENGTEVAGGTFKVAFDSTIANATSISAGDFGNPTFSIDNASGIVSVAVAQSNAPGKIHAIIANITFSVSAGVPIASNTVLRLMATDLNDAFGSSVTHSTINGELKVDGVRGDVNRNVRRDTGDATLILRSIVGLSVPTQYLPILPIGDMNCNDRIDTGDATLILRDVVNLYIPRCWETSGINILKAQASAVNMNIGESSIVIGQEVTLPLVIRNSNDIAGGSVNILFNPSILKAVSISRGDFGVPIQNIDNITGSMFIAIAGTTAIGKNEAILANITFRGEKEGNAPLNLTDAELNTEDGSLISPILGNGSITVSNGQIDTMPPQTITNPSLQAAGTTYINVTWLNPPTPTSPMSCSSSTAPSRPTSRRRRTYYNFTGLNPDTLYELGTHTVDTSGNINQTWVNATARTAPDTITPTTGPVHNINKGTNYTTIQAAINDASPGDEIHVDSGIYPENVNITRRLTLRGIGMPVVDARGSGSAITLSANGIRLEGFTVTGAGSNTGGGINVISNDNMVRDNNASSNTLGIYLNSSNFNNITGNNISNSASVGIKVYDTSTNNTISRNKVTNSSSGIFFVYAFNTTASNNIMENNSFNFGVGGNLSSHFDGNNIDTSNLANGRPIYYVKYAKNTIYGSSTKASTLYCISCDNVTVKDLEMSNMDRGVYFWETSNSRIQNITVKQSGWGIYLRQSPNNTITDSKFSTNNLQDYSERGVTIYSSNDNILTNNTFILNNYGLELYSSTKNTIYNNYFNNTNNFLFTGTTYVNTWNITKKPGINIIGGAVLGGNFWANPLGNGFSQICVDSNNYGLCDLKYVLNTLNVDNLPLKYKTAITAGITVVSPNGEENWIRGTTRIINWISKNNTGQYVKIELLKAGVLNRVIVASTLNDGTHPWPILATQAPGTDYKVRITSTSNASYTDTSDNNFTIPTPNITVITPNGGETWRRGTTQTIKWNSSGSPGTYVKIELLKGGFLNRVIVASTPNDGTHPWPILAAQASGTDYKVRITSTTNPAYNDTSDNSFTILTPSITVVTPNGGENWTRGTTKIINWSSNESPGTYVRIELLKPGKPNQLIVSATLNDGSHPWLIPSAQAPGSDYRVKITSTINVSNNDISDNYFTIPAPSFTVVSPDGGENWTRGKTQTIRWNSTENPRSYVKIELLKPGKPNQLIISATLNDGSHPWLIPAAQSPGSDYKVKITSTINVSNNDISDNYFTIPVPSFKVVSPNGGENLIRGTTQTIRWNSTESPGTYVKIELLKPGKPNQLIVSATLNDGLHPWFIPSAQAPGSDYKVKITSTINVSNSDISDGNFTIPVPSFTVVSPNGGENWKRGTTQTIKWTSTENPLSYVKIELLKAGVFNRLILASTINDGSHPWLIPATQLPGSDYKIRINSTINPAITDSGDNNFNITG